MGKVQYIAGRLGGSRGQRADSDAGVKVKVAASSTLQQHACVSAQTKLESSQGFVVSTQYLILITRFPVWLHKISTARSTT